MNRLFILLALLALHLLAACEPRETAPAKAIHVRAGKSFRITLRDLGTTGHRWVRVDPEAAASLTLVDSGPIPPRVYTDGGSGHRYWAFRAARPGEAAVSMLSLFYSDTTSKDTARFRVVIR